MDTKLLRTFVTIVDMRNFTRAGRRLGLSQSAISQQISGLEKELGVQLLVRSGGGARPTAAGEMLLQYARQILSRVDEAQRVLTDYDSAPGGVLRIGAGGAACHYLLPPVLAQFHGEFPQIELHVHSGHSALTMERLLNGDLDAGIVTLPVSHAKLRVTEIGRDELLAIAAPAHAWNERRRIQPTDFAGQPLLIYERRSQTFRLIERMLLEAGVFPRVVMEMDHLEAVIEMVRVGLGVAIVPRWTVREEIGRGELIGLSIGKSGLQRAWGVVSPELNQRPKRLRAFLRVCGTRLPELLSAERPADPVIANALRPEIRLPSAGSG
jgi:DNA-binding transcriptional LysR family regulator